MSLVHWIVRGLRLGCSLSLLGAFATGCSDPVTAPPQAAFEATFAGSSCAATVFPGPTIGIGVATASKTATYTNGTEGIFVGCRVVPQGSDFLAALRISRGSTAFKVEATIPNDPSKSANATTLTISGPNTAGGVYVPSSGTVCTVRFIEAAAGRIKASFDCPTMETNTSSPGAACAVSGMFVGEACSQE
jgi:hypothetical protein